MLRAPDIWLISVVANPRVSVVMANSDAVQLRALVLNTTNKEVTKQHSHPWKRDL